MAMSNKNVIIGAAAAMAVIIVIVVVVVSTGGNKFEYKRCDGLSGPLGEIKISSCPDPVKAGYCEIKAGEIDIFEFDFTPNVKFTTASIFVTGDNLKLEGDLCKSGVECPGEANVKETVKTKLDVPKMETTKVGKVQLSVVDPSMDKGKDQLFCVEFPAKVVAAAA